MEPSPLESVSRSLESSLDWWGVFLLVFTFIVAIGLVIEYWEPVREFIEECRRPAAAFPWYKLTGLTGGILITVGVFGEFWGAYKASRVETKLRENNHKIEESLNISAESAAKAAGRAKASADVALHKSEAANEEAGKAQGKANAVAKQVEQLDADLKKASVDLRKYIESVESKSNPRWRTMLLRGGWKALADELKGKPVSQFEILYAPEDEEAYSFATMLRRTLQEAGWTPLDVRPLKESDALEGKWGDIPGAPLATRSGAWWGMDLISKTGVPNPPWDHDKESAIAALMVGLGGGQGFPDPRMPENVIRIIIGQEQSGH
jgi:hypothetical protein